MPEQDFLVWAPSATSNIYSQSAYAALGTLGTGAINGIADVLAYNKSVRQATVMASVIAQALGAIGNFAAVDDGTTATLLTSLLRSLQIVGGGYAADSGSANAYVVTLAPVPASLTQLIGVPIRVKIATTNTGASTINVNGLGAIAIRNPDATTMGPGQLAAGAMVTVIYNGSTFQLLDGAANLEAPAASFSNGITVGASGISSSGGIVGSYMHSTGAAQIDGNLNVSGTTTADYFRSSLAAFGSGDPNRVPILNDFTIALGSNSGYARRPDGLIIQWGNNAMDGGGQEYFSLYTAFPSTFQCIIVSVGAQIVGNAGTFGADVNDNSSFLVGNSFAALGTPIAFHWFAIGY